MWCTQIKVNVVHVLYVDLLFKLERMCDQTPSQIYHTVRLINIKSKDVPKFC